MRALGFSNSVVNELMTVNAPKILGGSLACVCSGTDVYLAFLTLFTHLLRCWFAFLVRRSGHRLWLNPPNFLLLSSGVAELAVGSLTTYRAIIDPVLPGVGLPGSVFFSNAGRLDAFVRFCFGACVGYWSGNSWEDAGKVATTAAASAGMSATVTLIAKGAGLIAPFLGAGAGIATSLILRQVLFSKDDPDVKYSELLRDPSWIFFRAQVGLPFFGCPREPIGSLKEGRLLLDERALARMTETLAV